MHTSYTLSALMVATLLLGCIDTGRGGPGPGVSPGPDDRALAPMTLDELNARFPFDGDRTLDAMYGCERAGSGLYYILDLQADGRLDVYATLDNHDIVRRSGTHAMSGGVLSVRLPPNDFLILDEQTTRTAPIMGTLGGFLTPNMGCAIIGHRMDDPSMSTPNASYGCPTYSEGPGSTVQNVFEFQAMNESPAFAIPGSIFRQRDRYPTTSGSPLTTRGYGVYRREGDRFYGFWGTAFNDYENGIVTGTFSADGGSITVDQEPAANQVCNRRY